MSEMSKPKTLSEKLWDRHLVHEAPGEHDLLYIDMHLVHEVTSPQAFDGLRLAGRPVRRPDLTIATADHNVPTIQIERPIEDPISATQLAALDTNCGAFGIRLYPLADPGQGIVHVIGPEQGLTLPGMTIVCGDSHTSTHGAFGALAFGIGTSEVEHVLATQTLPQVRPKTMAMTVDGELQPGVTAKDVILAIIGKIGTGGGIGHIIEYRGSTIRSLSMEGRMTVCNMSIEAGAKAGMIAPDDITFAYRRRPRACSERRALGARHGRLEVVADRRRRGFRSRSVPRRCRDPAACLLGNKPWASRADRRGRSRIRKRSTTRAIERSRRARCDIWDSNRARRCARSRSIPCSSDRARTAGSKICVWRPRSSPAEKFSRVCGRWSCPVRCACAPRRSPRDSTGSSRMPDSNGVPQVARCAWG